MRIFARLSLVMLMLGLVAGPLVAAPVVAQGATVSTSTPSHARSALGTVAAYLAGAGVVFGITIRKDAGSIAQKFVTRAQAAAGDYKSGVQQAGSKWESNTGAAEANFEQGVQAAISDKRFGRGVSGKGSKYQTNAVNLGAGRYGPGVANAQDAYAKGMAPVLQTLQSISLPPKSFRGSPANQARANAVATALAALRTGK